MKFSERMGITEPRSVMQIDGIDEPLRTALYNYLYEGLYSLPESIAKQLKEKVWCDHWRKTRDELPFASVYFVDALKQHIFDDPWYEVYDLIEFIFQEELAGLFMNAEELNRLLERDMAGFRLVDGAIVPITDDAELATLAQALGAGDAYSGARSHVQKAIGFLSQKPEPDLGNAVREAISAVEAAAKVVVGDKNADLGKALAVLKKTGTATHPALLEAWQKMYGFAGDEKGIRHATIDGSVNVDFPFAKYMVVASAAFVNYLVAEQAKRQ